MFKKVSKKSVMLFVGVMAVCAFAMPAMASAASWFVDPSGAFPATAVLDSPNAANRLSFSVGAPVGAGSTCAIASFDVDIRSASDAVVTNAGFQNCMGTGAAVNCTATVAATRLPWTITNTTTTNITIHGVHVDALFENTPGNATACALPGNVTLTGNLENGSWSNTGHEVTFAAAAGLTAHIAALAGSFPATVSGTLASTNANVTMRD